MSINSPENMNSIPTMELVTRSFLFKLKLDPYKNSGLEITGNLGAGVRNTDIFPGLDVQQVKNEIILRIESSQTEELSEIEGELRDVFFMSRVASIYNINILLDIMKAIGIRDAVLSQEQNQGKTITEGTTEISTQIKDTL